MLSKILCIILITPILAVLAIAVCFGYLLSFLCKDPDVVS